ncbi:MAG: response regulator transcription factor [Rhodococcus sp. (in: high G+C Gram-positive bacteria)]|uniref:response regulator transcription factor n=1 Tax=Rhodococcus sp. TaxID=1831 RepID=UPI002ADB5D7F|nr:response regulator transcription factor [Rhodococcus sp. (in: high G+C Gram-positive bacteria)]
MILVVDDDPSVREAVVTTLESDGYEVQAVSDGSNALAAVSEHSFDAMVLDVMMPGIDGLSVCRILREQGNRIPILVLTARSEVGDRIAGLDAGADDYLPKPFDIDELGARVRALLRRAAPPEPEVQFGDLSLDPQTRRGIRSGRSMDFTATEFALLDLLIANSGQTLTREVISDRVWGQDFGPQSNSIAVYINYLRTKLEAGGESRIIHTVRGIGYRLELP